MTLLYALLLVVCINGLLLFAVFKGVQWLVNFQEVRNNGKTQANKLPKQ
jgi:hypothetical protein